MLLNKVRFVFLIFVFSKSFCNGDIASDLTKRYNDDRMKCEKNGKTKPAFQCSGLLIRGVRNNSQLKYAWSIKESGKERNAFSMAFLRKDTRFTRFPRDYDSGFIIYPHLKTPKNKNEYKVFCAFPVDAHSDGRSGEHGCGHSRDDPTQKSGHCNDKGIKTYNKWVSSYHSIMGSSNKNFVTRQCGFDMTTKTAAADFATVIKANTYLRKHSKTYAYRNNELVVHSWNEKKPKNLPIEAFFYIRGVSGAYEKAVKYQDQFRQACGETVPIVGIRLPTKADANISIKYKKPTKS